MEYVSPEQLAGFSKYKYSAVDSNPLSLYVMHPFWNAVVKLLITSTFQTACGSWWGSSTSWPTRWMAWMGSRHAAPTPARPWESSLTTAWTAGPASTSWSPCTPPSAGAPPASASSSSTSCSGWSCFPSSSPTGRSTTRGFSSCPGDMTSAR
uniref:Selenoprotein I n=1 Tax=Taeniopygia guttata TaxID=59729 RepID=A0A674G809_TAEGU